MKSLVATVGNASEEVITLQREDFSAESRAHLNHLKLHNYSGMACWLDTAGTENRTWTGISPKRCTVAYNSEGKAIGWCAIGYYRKGTDVIGTYVMPEYRRNGIGAVLIQETLSEPNEGQHTIAYDETGWDIIHLIRKADLQAVSFHDIVWSVSDAEKEVI